MAERGISPSPLETIGGTPLVRLRRFARPVPPPCSSRSRAGISPAATRIAWRWRSSRAPSVGASCAPGRRIVEFSGRSAGSSLAFGCAVKGYSLSIVSSDALSPEMLATMRAFGADSRRRRATAAHRARLVRAGRRSVRSDRRVLRGTSALRQQPDPGRVVALEPAGSRAIFSQAERSSCRQARQVCRPGAVARLGAVTSVTDWEAGHGGQL